MVVVVQGMGSKERWTEWEGNVASGVYGKHKRLPALFNYFPLWLKQRHWRSEVPACLSVYVLLRPDNESAIVVVKSLRRLSPLSS